MAPSIPSPLIPPGICRTFVFFYNVANAPRWGQLIRTNPHGGAFAGRVHMPEPWDGHMNFKIEDTAVTNVNWQIDVNIKKNFRDIIFCGT